MEIVDYALPCMNAERQIKKLHEAMLTGKYDDAMEAANQCIADMRMVYIAIVDERERHEARRQSED